jgi:hypothetical protein
MRNVYDRDVGLMGSGLSHQLLLVRCVPDHLKARLLEHARDSFTQQHRIIGDDHPHGILVR